MLTSLLVLLVVFVSGLLLGRSLCNSDFTSIDRYIKDSELNTESYLIEQALIENIDDCNFAEQRVDKMSQELANIGRTLSRDNAKSELGNNYDTLKRKFHLTQIKTYLIVNKLAERCELNDVVLFYYDSNEDSKKQGVILDDLVENNNIKVFAIEYNYSAELNFLEEYYNITQAPSVVVNFETKLDGLQEGLVDSLK